MQVILLENLPHVGKLGDVVKVADGYGRNYLLPKGHAKRATESSIKDFELRRADLERAAQEKLDVAKTLGEKLSGRTVRIVQKAGVDGRLFGSVTNADIAAALKKVDFPVEKSQVRLPNGPLKTTGEHTVSVAAHTDVVVDVTVLVMPEPT